MTILVPFSLFTPLKSTVIFLGLTYLAGYFEFSFFWILLFGLAWAYLSRQYRASLKTQGSGVAADLKDGLFRGAEGIQDQAKRDAAASLVLELISQLPDWSRRPQSEMVGWLNSLVTHLWPHIQTATEKNLWAALPQLLDLNKPEFLDVLYFTDLKLGSCSPLIASVEFQSTRSDEILLDLDIQFCLGDDSRIGVTVGKGPVEVRIAATQVQLMGKLRVNLSPLISSWPCFGNLSISFVEEPHLDLNLEAAGVTLTNIPFLSEFLRKQVQGILSSVLVWPTQLEFPMLDPPTEDEEAKLKARSRVPLGILQVLIVEVNHFDKDTNHTNLQNLSGLSTLSKLTNTTQVFCEAKVGGDIQRTNSHAVASNLTFNESFEFFVYDLNDALEISVFQKDLSNKLALGLKHKKRKGKTAAITLQGISPELDIDAWLPLHKVQSGHVHVVATWKPFLDNKSRKILSSRVLRHKRSSSIHTASKGLSEPKNAFSTAAVMIHLRRGKVTKGNPRRVKTQVRMKLGPQFQTSAIQLGENPAWEEYFIFPVKNLEVQHLVFSLLKSTDIGMINKTEVLGESTMTLKHFVERGSVKQQRIEMSQQCGWVSIDLKILELHADVPKLLETLDPIGGAVSVTVHKGVDLVAKDNNGLSDPYAAVYLGDTKRKTKISKKTLNPEWNQTFSFKVKDLRWDSLSFKVYDNDFVADEIMGTLMMPLNGLLLNPLDHITLPLEHTKRGGLVLSASFFPDKEVPRSHSESLNLHASVSITSAHSMQWVRKHSAGNSSSSSAGLDSKESKALQFPASHALHSVEGLHVFSWANQSEASIRRGKSLVKQRTMSAPQSAATFAEELAQDGKAKKGGDHRKSVSSFPGAVLEEEPALVTLGNEASAAVLKGKKKSGILKVVVHRGRDIPAMDKNGLCDPFVKVKVLNEADKKQKFKTSCKKKTLNPVWEEKFEFTVDDYTTDRLSFDVIDKDTFFDEHVGAVSVMSLNELAHEPDMTCKRDFAIAQSTKGVINATLSLTLDNIPFRVID